MIDQIHRLGGKLGMMLDDLENVPDAENYDYQVQTGLAVAVAEVCGCDPVQAVHWFGFCLIHCGVKMDDRIQCLLDSLRRELLAIEGRDDPPEADDTEDAGG